MLCSFFLSLLFSLLVFPVFPLSFIFYSFLCNPSSSYFSSYFLFYLSSSFFSCFSSSLFPHLSRLSSSSLLSTSHLAYQPLLFSGLTSQFPTVSPLFYYVSFSFLSLTPLRTLSFLVDIISDSFLLMEEIQTLATAERTFSACRVIYLGFSFTAVISSVLAHARPFFELTSVSGVPFY